jgi:hypothetical protein
MMGRPKARYLPVLFGVIKDNYTEVFLSHGSVMLPRRNSPVYLEIFKKLQMKGIFKTTKAIFMEVQRNQFDLLNYLVGGDRR